jgi:hypothetical protein
MRLRYCRLNPCSNLLKIFQFDIANNDFIVTPENWTAQCGKNQWDKTTMRKTYAAAFKVKLVL